MEERHLPSRPRARDRRGGDGGGQERDRVRGGRQGGRRVHGEHLPDLRELRGRRRELLLQDRLHLQLPRQGRHRHPRRLLRPGGRRRALRRPLPRRAAPGRRRAAALRGRHRVRTHAAPRAGPAGDARRRGGPRRPRPRRRQVRQGFRGGQSDRHQHVAREAGGGAREARRRRVRAQHRRRRDEGRRGNHARNRQHGVHHRGRAPVPRAPQATRQDGPARRPREAHAGLCLPSHRWRQEPDRELHGEHQGDAGDAGLRGRAWLERRCRGDRGGRGEHGHGAPGQGRCQVPLRHRRRQHLQLPGVGSLVYLRDQ